MRTTDVDDLIAHAISRQHENGSRRLSRALLDNSGINVIAEFKRASPSKGPINSFAKAAGVADAYRRGGACAISVLTEEDYFLGSLDDLSAIRKAVDLPILRKDFIIDEYQIYESAAAGADAILLIVGVLTDKELLRLRSLAEDQLGLDALVEVHTAEELERSVAAGSKLIGVNNRNLDTFEVSIDTSRSLIKSIPEDTIAISESGLGSAEDLGELTELGFKGFLIGEALMKHSDPEAELKRLTGERVEAAITQPKRV